MRSALIERAEAYRLLAAGFRHPEPAELQQAYAEASAASERLARFADLADCVDDDLAADFTRLFSTHVAASPYETQWLRTDKGARLGQLAALYQLFGVKLAPGEHELPDHVGTELEFASLLCVKQALASDDDELSIAERARKVFTEEHLGRWIPPFADKLADQAAHPFYVTLAQLLTEVVADDLSAHGWTASDDAAFVGAPGEPDCMSCPAARGGGEVA